MKIREDINLKELIKYGFKLEPEKSYYYNSTDEIEVFVWITKGYDYKPRHIYMETKDCCRIITDFNIIFNLIKDGLAVKTNER